ncbi:hypothetical protein Tco_0550152 [Tanacetum coccineum]
MSTSRIVTWQTCELRSDPTDKIELPMIVNENALADTGSDINTMPFRIYVQLGRDDMKKVGVTTLDCSSFLDRFSIADLDRDSSKSRWSRILVDFGESDVMTRGRLQVNRNKFGAPIYGPKPAPYLSCKDPAERSLAIKTSTIEKEETSTGA